MNKYTGYFTNDNESGSKNATHNTFSKQAGFLISAVFGNVLWVAFSIPSLV
jgi:hypothetical protein